MKIKPIHFLARILLIVLLLNAAAWARTTRYVTSSGSDTYANSTSSSTPMSLSTAFANAAAGDDIMIAEGTYSRSANDTPANAGTIVNQIRYIGCTSSWVPVEPSRNLSTDRLDTSHMPNIAYGSGFIFVGNGVNNVSYAGINFTGAASTQLVRIGTNALMYRCVVTNSQNNNSSIRAVANAGGQSGCVDCDLICSGSTTTDACFSVGAGTAYIISCTLTNPTSRGISAATTYVASGNRIIAAVGIDAAAAGMNGLAISNTFNCTTAAMRGPNGVSTAAPWAINNMLTDSGYAFQSQYVATAQTGIFRIYNRTRDNTNADSGFDNWPSLADVTTDTGNASSDYRNAAGGDLRLAPTSPARGAGVPPSSDIGALQHQDISPALMSRIANQ